MEHRETLKKFGRIDRSMWRRRSPCSKAVALAIYDIVDERYNICNFTDREVDKKALAIWVLSNDCHISIDKREILERAIYYAKNITKEEKIILGCYSFKTPGI